MLKTLMAEDSTVAGKMTNASGYDLDFFVLCDLLRVVKDLKTRYYKASCCLAGEKKGGAMLHRTLNAFLHFTIASRRAEGKSNQDGQLTEVIDEQHKSQSCIGTVNEAQSPRAAGERQVAVSRKRQPSAIGCHQIAAACA
jgi:hypothetical protein